MTLSARSRRAEIRALTPADTDAVLGVYRECEDFLALGPEPRVSPSMVLADMETSRREGGIFGGVYRRGKPIGIVDFIPNGFISLLMVARPFRGKGLGGAVVGLVEGRIQSGTVRTAVQVNNADGLRFWQKMGYRTVSEPEQQPDGTTTVRMEKRQAKGQKTRG